jgi:hypothetical protein
MSFGKYIRSHAVGAGTGGSIVQQAFSQSNGSAQRLPPFIIRRNVHGRMEASVLVNM